MFRNKTRLMTTIRGIPFYRSTGKNSDQPGTWFPCKGIEEEFFDESY